MRLFAVRGARQCGQLGLLSFTQRWGEGEGEGRGGGGGRGEGVRQEYRGGNDG